jgi:Uma2 family endonuclease
MQRQSRQHYSLDDYFAVEEASTIKHEYYDGEIFAMAGSSVNHNHISANVLAALRTGLRQSACSTFGSDLRLQTPGGLYTYPDVMVICGEVLLTRDRPDTVTNPSLIVEVLSNATREYDRGEKFTPYQDIPALREYLLIEQDDILVEHFVRTGEVWTQQRLDTLDSTVSLQPASFILSLREVYLRVFS